MKQRKKLRSITAIVSIGLIIFQPFQQYAYANSISESIDNSANSLDAEGQKPSQNENAKDTNINLNLDSDENKLERSQRSLFDNNRSSSISSNNIVSDAYNFKNISQSVDPRTGSFSASYKVTEVKGNLFEDPTIPLSLHYSSLSNSDKYGLGKGWSWNLSNYDKNSGMISLSSGGSYKLETGKIEKLKYYKLKDIIITLQDNFIFIKYKDGKEEKIDRTFGNLVKVTNKEGFSAIFNYTNGTKLQSIHYLYENNDSIEKLNLVYSDGFITIKSIQGEQSFSSFIIKKNAAGRLISIRDPINLETTFKYEIPKNDKFVTDNLISEITYSTGTKINVFYLKQGLKGAKETLIVPAVEKITTQVFPSSTAATKEELYYSYEGENNFLGRGFNEYKDGEDTLFNTANTYYYITNERKPTENGFIDTKRKYNHFHQIVKETMLFNNSVLQTKEYIYPEWELRTFERLDRNYNFPKEIKTTYYQNGKLRTESVKQEYDDYGNLLKTEDVSGIITEYKYLLASETYNSMAHLPKRVVTSSKYGTSSRIVEYVYEYSKNAEGKNYQRLIATVNKYSPTVCKADDASCGTVYKTELKSYNAQVNLGNKKISAFSLPSFTQVLASDKGKCKVTKSNFQYSSNGKLNTVTKNFSGSVSQSESPLQIVTSLDSYTQQVKRKTTMQNKIADIQYEYDVLGRVTKETIGKNTAKPFSTNYQYSFPEFGKSAVKVVTSTGQANYIVYDSLGRVIEEYKDSFSNPDKKVFSYEYTLANLKRKETAFNKDVNGEHYNLSVEYKYDAFGREKEVISADKTVKYTDYDDVALTQSSFIKSLTSGESSPKSLVKLNISKKPVSTSLYSPSGSHHSTSTNQYDGFGNLIQSIDVLGNKMRYEYDLKGNKIADIYNDGKQIHYVYDVLFEDQITEKSVTTSDGKNILLGQRKYNELGQMITDSDPSGKSIQYFYDSKGNNVKQILRSGKEILFTYDDFNNLIKKEVLGDSKSLVEYTYDSNNQPIRMKDSLGTTTYNYFRDGKLKSKTYPDNLSLTYNYDLQGNLIESKDIEGNKTRYHYSSLNGKLIKSEFINLTAAKTVHENYNYDGLGRIKQRILANGAFTNYQYDEFGSLENLSHYDETRDLILSYSYKYYQDFNIATRTRVDKGNKTAFEGYIYDAMNNLKEYSCSGNLCPKDQVGNRVLSEKYTFDGLNNIKTVESVLESQGQNTTTYFYSNQDPSRLERYSNTNPALGKLESATIQYDLDGNIVRDDEGNTLSYNAFNRLVSFQKNAQTTEYFYNGQGTLVSQKNPGNSKELKFYYSGNTLVNEKQGNIINSYFNSNGKISGKFTTGNTEQYYLTDQANSVIRIMEGKKLLANNYVYTPYGIQTDLNVTLVGSSGSTGDSSIIKTSIGFDGQRTDAQTGYQFLGKGYRAYNPVLHRFMQYDSFSPFGKGGINGYTFAENNPIMNFDPTGESAALNIGLAVGFAIIGIIASIFTFGAAAGAVSVGFAVAGTALGAASGATGIAGAVYEKKAEDAAKSGNKDAAASYAKTASDLGWASLGLGLAGAAADIGSLAFAAGKKGTYNLVKASSQRASTSNNIVSSGYKTMGIFDPRTIYASASAKISSSGAIRAAQDVSDSFKISSELYKPIMGFANSVDEIAIAGEQTFLYKNVVKSMGNAINKGVIRSSYRGMKSSNPIPMSAQERLDMYELFGVLID